MREREEKKTKYFAPKLNVLGKPESVIVSMNNGTELEDGAILGPYTEGTNLVLRCKASGGRPIPEVRTIFNLYL